MRRLLEGYNRYTIANLNYQLDVEADFFEYQMVIRTNERPMRAGWPRPSTD